MKRRRPISLIEILMIASLIAILVSLAIIAINPVLHIALSRDASRWDDLNGIGNALALYAKDHAGVFPVPITETPAEICGRAQDTQPCAMDRLLDLSWLMPRYLLHIPSDPAAEYASGAALHSGYSIARLSNGALLLSALRSEGERIDLVREDVIHSIPSPAGFFHGGDAVQ